jgi:hypothetical protein
MTHVKERVTVWRPPKIWYVCCSAGGLIGPKRRPFTSGSFVMEAVRAPSTSMTSLTSPPSLTTPVVRRALIVGLCARAKPARTSVRSRTKRARTIVTSPSSP